MGVSVWIPGKMIKQLDEMGTLHASYKCFRDIELWRNTRILIRCFTVIRPD